MCGIIGYTGPLEAKDVLLKGLAGLEYRGYDSAGIAYFNQDSQIDPDMPRNLPPPSCFGG